MLEDKTKMPKAATPLRVENGGATSIKNDTLTYIKEHIESDLQANRRMAGADLSHFLSEVLGIYETALRIAPKSYENNFMINFSFKMMALRPSVQSHLGKQVWFHETVKVGLAMLNLYQEKGDAGLDEIAKYSEELGEKELSPEDTKLNDAILELLEQHQTT
jgi:hypothetical protein